MSTPLRRTLLHRPWAVWLAVLIAVFGALAPTVSHALVLARGGASPMVEICTTTGTQWVLASTAADSPDEQEPAMRFDHCPFCLHSVDRTAPPPHLSPIRFAARDTQCEIAGEHGFFIFGHFALTPPLRGPPFLA
jgi:hypothetical protein